MKWYENNTFNLYWSWFIYDKYILDHSYIHSYILKFKKKSEEGKQTHLIYMYNMCIIIHKRKYQQIQLH